MNLLRRLWSLCGIYGEALWAFLHPHKIMEAEINSTRMFTGMRLDAMERRIQRLEKQQNGSNHLR